MLDPLGERLKKQIAIRRRDRWHYLLLYSFLGVNGAFITYQLIKHFI